MESHEVSFEVAKDDLADAVSWVARHIPSKAPQPVLRAMIIRADDEGLELAGFDYELSTRVRVSAEVNRPGRVAVAGRLINEIVGTLPDKPVAFVVEEGTARLRCGSSNFELPVIPLDDYPTIPTLPEVTGSIEAGLFNEAVSQVAVAAGKDETIPMLTGVHMRIEGENITLAATDRFRLARRHVTWRPVDPEISATLLIPAKTLQDNARSQDSQTGEDVNLAVGTGEQLGREGLFGLGSARRETTTRMLDTEFPNIDPLFPSAHTALAAVEIAPFVEAARRVSLVGERNGQILLQFSAGEVLLSAGGTDNGHAEEAVPCAFHGEEGFTISFNSGFLRDGLGVMPGPRAVFGFTEASRPAIIVPEPEELPEAGPDGSFPTPASELTYLLMPVRLPG